MDEFGDDMRETQQGNAAEDQESDQESGEESDQVVRDVIAHLRAAGTIL